MMRDLNDLQFFAAVVQNRGFSAAARILVPTFPGT
jgi:DNA-binding transcriptional LysR family regulator